MAFPLKQDEENVQKVEKTENREDGEGDHQEDDDDEEQQDETDELLNYYLAREKSPSSLGSPLYWTSSPESADDNLINWTIDENEVLLVPKSEKKVGNTTEKSNQKKIKLDYEEKNDKMMTTEAEEVMNKFTQTYTSKVSRGTQTESYDIERFQSQGAVPKLKNPIVFSSMTSLTPRYNFPPPTYSLIYINND